MQPREAFKIGFLARCVEQGLSPEATHNLVKSAEDCFKSASFGLTDTINAIKGIAYPSGFLAAGAPIAVGSGAAYFANKANDTDATDIEEIKQKELLETYGRMADQLERRKKLQAYKADRKRTGQVFL